MNREEQLRRFVRAAYAPEEFPALEAQCRRWRATRPLANLRVLDATPVFRNTVAKYLALVAGGAEVSVHVGRGIPADCGIVEALPELGVPVLDDAALAKGFDAVLDCGGVHNSVPSRLGYVELTRSGMYRYRQAGQPVFLADAGRIKVIETGLGTGDGFRRGMEHFGYGAMADRAVVLFGCGKVGHGIALHALRAGARLTVIDEPGTRIPAAARLVSRRDPEAVEAALRPAWCVVTATGHAAAVSAVADPGLLLRSDAILVNMGVEDEYGAAIPAERVLNRKQPLNFVLNEPTQLKYIDPTMALDNAGILELAGGSLAPGINQPRPELEDAILADVKSSGAIAPELTELEPYWKERA